MKGLDNTVRFVLERMREGRVVFFLGAGVSAAEAGLPNGSQLAERLLREMGESRSGDKPLPAVAEQYERTHDRIALINVLKRKLKFKGDIKDAAVCKTYKLLQQLPLSLIVTTNFDDLIEESAKVLNTELETYRMNAQLADFPPGGRKLLKIHGDFNVPANDIVVTETDYRNYQTRCPLFCHEIQNIVLKNTIVFLGYSLSDSNFLHLYNEVLQKVGPDLKLASFAVMNSLPEPDVRKAWTERRVEFVQGTAIDFVGKLRDEDNRATGAASTKFQVPATVMPSRATRPIFGSSRSDANVRKNFAHFVAGRKLALKEYLFRFCTIDTLLDSRSILHPERSLARRVHQKASDIAEQLSRLGYGPIVMPFVDLESEQDSIRRIKSADFCIVLVSGLGYEERLNRMYGGVARSKPIVLFLHKNLEGRFGHDMVLNGLEHCGANLGIYKTKDVAECRLKAAVVSVLREKSDSWLARTIL